MRARPELCGEIGRREMNPHRALLERLFAELLSAERSAERDPARRAAALGEGAPSRALRAVCQHAASVRGEIAELARERDLIAEPVPEAGGGALAGARAILARAARRGRRPAAAAEDAERGYRASLLALRHGVDLVKTIRATAEAADDGELAAWCTEWLAVREPLVEDVCEQLAWFGWHPERALHDGSSSPGVVRRTLERITGSGSATVSRIGIGAR